MAEGSSINQVDVVCRYFLSGNCRDEDNCLFSHDITRGGNPDSVCRYYLQGRCIFGQECKFDHILLNSEIAAKNHSNNEVYSAGPSRCFANRDTTYSFTIGDMSQRNNNLPRRHYSNSNRLDNSVSTNWANAPEFFPEHFRSYAEVAKTNVSKYNEPGRTSEEICPLFIEGHCPFPDCRLVHGNVCQLCQKRCLHPFNEELRKSHIEKCEKEFEENMEFSFAVQRSLDKTCGICMDVVIDKEPISERRFGILEKCNHVYCLSCIRKWRASGADAGSRLRACPECRIVSNFIIPNAYFIDDEEEKQKLIAEYKKALSEKPCKYFKQGNGICMFGESCFYLHATPDGRKVPSARRRQNQDAEFNLITQILLWDYLENRDANANVPENMLFPLSDTDDDFN